jgi:HemY protein
MKLIFWLLTLIIAAGVIAFATKYNSGYVLLVAQEYRIELSLNMLLVLLIALFSIFYFLVRLIVATLRLPTKIREFRTRKNHEEAHVTLLNGMKEFLEGRHIKAEKTANKALKFKESSEFIAVNAAIAARSAHELSKYSQRDEFITVLECKAPDEKALHVITKAELLLDENHHEEALKILHTLDNVKKNQQNAILRLELKAQQQANNWEKVLDLADQLMKRHALNKTLAEELRHRAHLENFKNIKWNKQLLQRYWRNMPSIEKENNTIAYFGAQAHIALGDCTTAHQIIEKSLNKHWNSELVSIYADCMKGNITRQIEYAETWWLKFYPNDFNLLLTLGKLCIRGELWGKAQNYLEESIAIKSSYEAHLMLALLNEKIGKPEIAKDHYTKGLEASQNPESEKLSGKILDTTPAKLLINKD